MWYLNINMLVWIGNTWYVYRNYMFSLTFEGKSCFCSAIESNSPQTLILYIYTISSRHHLMAQHERFEVYDGLQNGIGKGDVSHYFHLRYLSILWHMRQFFMYKSSFNSILEVIQNTIAVSSPIRSNLYLLFQLNTVKYSELVFSGINVDYQVNINIFRYCVLLWICFRFM